MKRLIGVIGITVLFSLLGTIAPAYAQEQQHQEQAKPEQHAQQKQQAQHQKQKTSQDKSSQNAQRKQGAQQSKSGQQAQQQERAQRTNPSQHPEQKQAAQQSKSAQHAQQQQRAQQARPAQQNERAGNNGGGRIPDDRFRAHFGRDHDFRIDRFVMVSGSRRFQYGGYWFGFIDPWPVGWTDTDQVYVDYMNGGYYLLSPVHPGIQISISVLL